MATQPALFRQEAIDFLRQRNSWGEVVSLQPLSSTILSWTFAGLVVVILCFLSIAQYARKETVSGYLTPTSGTAKIFVPQQGFIKEIKVNRSHCANHRQRR
jgi:membrane fusion protein